METTSKFVCDTCKFTTNYKNVIDKHLSSKKHKDKHDIETADKYSHICSKCNRTYSSYSGLWKHQKKCTDVQEQAALAVEQQNTTEQNTTDNAIQMEIMEPDEEIQTRIKMNIIKILLEHVNRDELNKIIDEIYDGK
jgi:hypothetical protein